MHFSTIHYQKKWNFSLFFLEKKSEIWNAFTYFENEKWNENALKSRSRMKSEMKRPWNRDREWKVKWKCLEIETEKWNFKIILENSRETRLSQVTGTCILHFTRLKHLKGSCKYRHKSIIGTGTGKPSWETQKWLFVHIWGRSTEVD